jgi:hypothetical protein
MNAHRWTLIWFATFMALTGVLLLSTGQANASLSEFSFSGAFVAGEVDEGIAIDESSGDVYVYDSNGNIRKFDADGVPVDFSALGSNTIAGVGTYGGGETELAVDNSTSPAKGDIYLAGGSGVKIFGSDGSKLAELTEVAGRPWGEVACGVAVDGSGHVYVGLYPSNIDEYTPTTNPVTNGDYTASHGGLNEICEIASDHEGNLYASTWTPNRKGAIVELNGFQLAGTKQIVSDASGTLAVANSPSAELFFNRSSEILQYDPTGNPLSTFGAEESVYYAVAINAKNGKLYDFNVNANAVGGRRVEIWQGLVTPEVRTNQATGLDSVGSVILNGTVNPEGVSVESCAFQYGSSTAYGSVAPCAQGTPLTGSGILPVSTDVSDLTLNHTYHYRLSATDEHGTVNGADQTFTILVLPTAEDQPPTVSAITRASASLTGTIDPEQADTRYHFEYGTSESYGNTTPFLHTGDGIAGDVTISQQLGELAPDTTYHYRMVASNIAGTVYGADHTFVTSSPTPPFAVTGGSSGIAENNSVIGGLVKTNGLPTTYGFELGTSTDYGPPTGLGSVGAGLSETSVLLSLTGLVSGTTYHYRITATNIDGTSYGADRTFTTSVFTSTFAEPPAPLPFVTVPSIVFPSEAKPVVKKPGRKTKKKVKRHSGAKGKGKAKTKNKKKK